MDDWTQTLGTGPLLGIAAAAVAVILILIIRFRVHAFITLVVVSALTAIAAGVPISAVYDTMSEGFGSTLASVAILVALGAMLGRLIEHSGGAKALADRMVDTFGEKRAPFALGVSALILGFPMFFDAGLVMMLPIVFAVARRLSSRSVLLYAIPTAAAFSVMHVFLPPHPGPVSATEFYEANLGLVLLVGLVIAFPLWYVAGAVWGRVAAARTPLPVPTLFGAVDDDQPTNPPRVGTVISLLLLPMLLILMNTGLNALGSVGAVDSGATWVAALSFLGTSAMALLITVIVATFVLGHRRGEDGSALEKLLDSSLGPICSVVLITGAGGMFGGVLQASGIGAALEDSLSDVGLPVFIAAYLIAVILRLAQGSATVALVTAAGLVSPAVLEGDFNALQVACIVLVTAAGSVFAGHVNDSGFWLVGRLLDMDVKTTLKTWTVQQALQSVIAFVLVGVIYLAASAV
ncbi:GntP family permease [Nesterenkonia sp. F]|uniref:GntP family permease n=1 Tax=Nesterenkonia sp. F TaxID=795955 RepID=UPI000255CCD9|nr:GntP family permease [Nesterenkonia sp. F]